MKYIQKPTLPLAKQAPKQIYIVGIDQTLVDIEAKVDDDFIQRYQLSQEHSLVIEETTAEELYRELTERNLIHTNVGELKVMTTMQDLMLYLSN